MTTRSLRPYLHLIALGKPSTLASDLARDLPAETIDALLRARLLEEGPEPDEYPCDRVYGTCARVIIPYVGPGQYAYRAVPPGRSSCCEHLDLLACDVRTFLVPESRLIRMCSEWLGIDAHPADPLYRGLTLQRIGSVRDAVPRMQAFFARRVDTRVARERLLELAEHGPSLVLAPLRDGLSLALQDLARNASVHFVFLEDVLAVANGKVAIAAPHPLRVANSGRVSASCDDRPVCRLLTLEGERRLTQPELDQERAKRLERDLFIDFTTTAKGGGIPAWMRQEDTSTAQAETVLKPLEGKILLEYVRAQGRPLAPDRLRCIREAGIRDGMRRFRDLRSKIDVRYSRDQYRMFHSCKGAALQITEYFFKPPSGYSMAVVLPLDRSESEGEDGHRRGIG